MAAGDFQLPVLSGSTNGKPIPIAGTTAGTATTIHTMQSGTSGVDEVELHAVNTDTVARTLTILLGGTATANQLGPITLGVSRGLVLVLPAGSVNNGEVLSAFADAANVINVYGRVGRYTNTA